MRHEGGDKVMAQVLAAVPTAGLEAVLVAVELVVESGALSVEHVLNVLARLKEANNSTQPALVQTQLTLIEAPLANTDRYDSLRLPADATNTSNVSNVMEVNHAS
jgi:hypothetical protein